MVGSDADLMLKPDEQPEPFKKTLVDVRRSVTAVKVWTDRSKIN